MWLLQLIASTVGTAMKSYLDKIAEKVGLGLYTWLQASFKTLWGIISGLIAFEGSPVVGLIMLMWFEAWTGWLVDEHQEHWWRKWWRIVKERLVLTTAVLAVVVYANTSDQVWIKESLIVTLGGALLFVGWIRLGKRYPVVKLLQAAIERAMKGRGLSIDMEDEEGKHHHVDGIVKDVRHIEHDPEAPAVKRKRKPKNP